MEENLMLENIRTLVDEVNNLNTRSDLSYVGNRQFFEEYALVHNSINQLSIILILNNKIIVVCN